MSKASKAGFKGVSRIADAVDSTCALDDGWRASVCATVPHLTDVFGQERRLPTSTE